MPCRERPAHTLRSRCPKVGACVSVRGGSACAGHSPCARQWRVCAMRICLVSFSPCRQVVVVVTHDQFVTGVTNLLCCHATTYAGALERYDAAEHHRPATTNRTGCALQLWLPCLASPSPTPAMHVVNTTGGRLCYNATGLPCTSLYVHREC